ncbi:hypothetical protein [Actinomadura algeriensis]|uniref:Integral membrane protein n=1 Tax=Actinomadura algeriensis TaxID=1679523 RepID=A0ABR9JKD3_9ACTN|nr:hypothetical protein [Actinomadura algeriensis]MBE1531002.1 hypothetical protein [Actinomadura algeriensis]
MIHLFEHRIIDSGRLPLFGFFVAFIVTFVLTRVNVRLIRADVRWWFRNVKAGDVHIHHVVFGVVLMLVGGVASLAVPDGRVGLDLAAAVVFGMGSALVLDEFALILHLSDVYWTEKGRASVDAVFVAIAVTGLLLLGVNPLGLESSPVPAVPGIQIELISGFYVASLAINLVLAVFTLLKGKIWTGLIGLFVPALLIVGAVRVARPGSPWSRWRYAADSRKYARAVHREKRIRRPLIRGKIWVQEFIAGRHDLIPPELRNRRPATERARRRRLARTRRRTAARAQRRAASRVRTRTTARLRTRRAKAAGTGTPRNPRLRLGHMRTPRTPDPRPEQPPAPPPHPKPDHAGTDDHAGSDGRAGSGGEAGGAETGGAVVGPRARSWARGGRRGGGARGKIGRVRAERAKRAAAERGG